MCIYVYGCIWTFKYLLQYLLKDAEIVWLTDLKDTIKAG